jgi:ribosomal protein S21
MAKSKHNQKDAIVSGLGVEVKNNDLGRALRKLKKKIAEDGILQDIRAKEFYESKGTKRRKAKLAAIRRFQKQRAKDQDNW